MIPLKNTNMQDRIDRPNMTDLSAESWTDDFAIGIASSKRKELVEFSITNTEEKVAYRPKALGS